MARTINRQPLSVRIPGNKSSIFVQAEFKGICDDKNDVTVEQQTFADAKNVYVDDSNVLRSRPPFKFYGNDNNIIKEWSFGIYNIRLYHTLTGYAIKCGDVTHSITSSLEDPNVFCAQIEDKIYIWFAGVEFLAFNTTSLVFEDATKYLYIPIHKLVTNNIETDLETKNFLTEYYRKRYQYSATSDVNFERLVGKTLSVGLNGKMTNDTSKHLYDVEVQEHQEELLVYPYSQIGSNYKVDIVQTSRATVILRYSEVFETIEVSFDGKSYRPLPVLENILGTPQLTKDGLYVVAFTNTSMAKCKLVASETEDFMNSYNVLSWERVPYLEKALGDGGLPISVDLIYHTIPHGYFETIDNFAVFFFNGGVGRLYTEWLSGSETVWAYKLTSELPFHAVPNDNIKIHFKYVTPTTDIPDIGPVVTVLSEGATDYPEGIFITYFVKETDLVGNTGICKDTRIINFKTNVIRVSNSVYVSQGYSYSCDRMDVCMQTPIIEDASILSYKCKVAYSIQCSMAWVDNITYKVDDVVMCDGIPYGCIQLGNLGKDPVTNNAYWELIPVEVLTEEELASFVLEENAQFDCFADIELSYDVTTNQDSFSTHDYRYNYFMNGNSSGFKIMPPNTVLTDKYLLANGIFGMQTYLPQNGELSPVVDDTERLVASNDMLSISGVYDRTIQKLTADGSALASGSIVSGDTVSYGDKFIIEKLVGTGPFKSGDLVRLTDITNEYPAAPNGWTAGDEWPLSWRDIPKPAFTTPTGIRYWSAELEDTLPLGLIKLYGYISIIKQIIPLSVSDTWYYIDGVLWTSMLSTDNFLELDESVTLGAAFNSNVPDYSSVLQEYYFSFDKLLEVTADRRDDDLDLLLYLPKRNEQRFANKITNLHPFSEDTMGVFTDSEIWYVQKVTLGETGNIAYTRPTKSKIPVGCRDGDSVITALDGQAIIFPTERGLTAMAPQDFIATAEPSLNYLSDIIQERYYNFYNKPIESSLLVGSTITTYTPTIKIVIYRYWMLLYRPMGREILVFDTRNTTWWNWETPYPIRSLTSGHRLQALFETAYSPIEPWGGWTGPGVSLLGVSYIWADKDALPAKDFDTGYWDDITENTLNGDIEYEDTRKIIKYVSPIIDWHFRSQKLHFNQINNYKAIEAITVNLVGEGKTIAQLTTKAYRDIYHPEKSLISQIAINELRTFVQRLNLMHVVNFEYEFENEKVEKHLQQPLRLNSLSIKYSIKEGVR